jgi:hypothetical protein
VWKATAKTSLQNWQLGGIKEKFWAEKCWEACVLRAFRNIPVITVLDQKLDSEEIPSTSSASAGPLALANESSQPSAPKSPILGEAGETPAVEEDIDVSDMEEDNIMDMLREQTYLEMQNTMFEDGLRKAILQKIPYMKFIDSNKHTHLTEQFKLAIHVEFYMNNFEQQWLVYEEDKEQLCRSWRVWITEFVWCLDELKNRNELPYDLWHPMDNSGLRQRATKHRHHEDDGNMSYDVMFSALRLYDYVDPVCVRQVMKLTYKPYGTSGNKSGEGPVNFRGNIIEATMYNFQLRGSKILTGSRPIQRPKYRGPGSIFMGPGARPTGSQAVQP